MSDVIRRFKRAEFDRTFSAAKQAGTSERGPLLNAAFSILADEDKLREIATRYESREISGREVAELFVRNYFNICKPWLTYPKVLELARLAHEAVGYLSLDFDKRRPDESILLYRGATEAGKRGLSWGKNRQTTERLFAAKSDEKLYRVVVAPAHLLGEFSKIGEDEYWVDYELIDEPEIVPSED